MTVTIGTLSVISGISVLVFMNDIYWTLMLYYYALLLGFGIEMTAPTIAATITDIFHGPEVCTKRGFKRLVPGKKEKRKKEENIPSELRSKIKV